MKKILWTDEMSIGVELVDEQHKMLIQHLNDLTNAIESHHSVNQIVKTLDFLIEYTNFHFTEEEKHMSETNYPGLEHQKI
ncbi:hemerythrin domain-containing protein, partial [bacterium]|nr:hemerythrin domain-containing protein [bacterium]